jgi:hypothetical protein
VVNNHNLPFLKWNTFIWRCCTTINHITWKKIPLPLFFRSFSLHFYNFIFTINVILVLVITNHVLNVKEFYSIIASVPNHHHSEIGGVVTNCNYHHDVGVCLWGKLIQLPSTLLWFWLSFNISWYINFIVLIRKSLVVIAYDIVSFLKIALFPIIVGNSWRIYGSP